MEKKIKILLVSEARLVGGMMSSLLEDEPDIEVVGYASDIEEVLRYENDYDLILASTALPGDGALKLTDMVTNEEPEAKIVVFGMSDSKANILKYVEAGASGYILKDHSVDELTKRIKLAAQDKAAVSPDMAGVLIQRLAELAQLFSDVEAIIDQPHELTPREQEILELIGEGLTNQEIANRLYIELGTVKNHVHSILQKLNVDSRRKAAAFLALIKNEE